MCLPKNIVSCNNRMSCQLCPARVVVPVAAFENLFQGNDYGAGVHENGVVGLVRSSTLALFSLAESYNSMRSRLGHVAVGGARAALRRLRCNAIQHNALAVSHLTRTHQMALESHQQSLCKTFFIELVLGCFRSAPIRRWEETVSSLDGPWSVCRLPTILIVDEQIR